MRKYFAVIGVALVPAVFVGCGAGAGSGKSPVTDEEKTVYAIGLSMSSQLKQLALTPEEVEIVKKALSDDEAGKAEVSLDEWGPKMGEFARDRALKALAEEKERGQAYQDKAAAEPGATKTASGLIYKDLTPGTGPSPAPANTVQVNYKGTFIDGTEFDSSYKSGTPAEFPLNGVIRCWTEGVAKMKVGGKAQLVCPSDIAYGDGGRPSIPGGATLVFEVELLKIVN